jgi:CheY-like chemotaxis protein
MGNISLAKIYLAEGKPESAGALLDIAEEASEAAGELSFRLLTFSKGGDPVRKISSIEGLMRRSAALALSGSNVTAAFALAPDLCLIHIDEGQMLQVFNNIIVNAREAMPRGGIVTITGENSTITGGDSVPLKKGLYAKISIKDTGCGIPRMNLGRIFDPYFSTKGLGSRKGTGLGLSICMSVIKKHDGHISAESEEGAGATFHIWLPGFSERREAVLAKKQPVSGKILFMDDDERIRNLVENMMLFLGYEVTSAGSGEEAIEIYSRAKASGRGHDAVILDLTIQGGMGGDQAVKRLLEIDPGVKAVISSGYADSPVLEHFREYGFVDAIAKPYRVEQLKALLDKLFSAAGQAGTNKPAC